MHGPSKSQNMKTSVQWSSGRPGARSGRGRCRPPAGSRRSQCLPIPCLVIINIGGMQKKKMTKTKDKDTLPLLPASAIRCRRGELEAPVPSSRRSPWVANAATVRRMLGEPWYWESILTAVANAEPFLSKSPWIISIHSVDFLSTITCLPAIVGWLDCLEWKF